MELDRSTVCLNGRIALLQIHSRMSPEQIRIERIKIRNLVDFANQTISSTKVNQLIPITMQRAAAHVNNPYADGDDVGLLVAYYANVCVGYFGIMPILLKHGEQFSKVHWFSTWLVSPKFRGRSIGSLLLKDALSMNLDYVIVGSGPARKVCKRFGFREFEPLVYYALDMGGMKRMNPTTWLFRFFRKILAIAGVKINVHNFLTRGFERLVTPVSKRVFYSLFGRTLVRRLKDINYQEVNQVCDSKYDSDLNLPDIAFYRGVKIINWMIKYPWVVEPGQSPTEHLDYYFSDVRNIFRNIALEVYSSDQKIFKGFVVMSISKIGDRMVLKVLDFDFINRSDEEYVLPLALKYGSKFLADIIELPKIAVMNVHGSFSGNFLLHEKKRIYQCYTRDENSPLGRYWQDIELNYCDGDMAFT